MKYLAPPEVPNLSADPASAGAGALYRNTGSGLLRMYSGSAWSDVGAAGASASTTVVAETSYGQASAVGTSAQFARGDHTHGTPPTPVTSLAAGTNISVSASTGTVTVSAPNAANVGSNNTFTGTNTFSGTAAVSGTLQAVGATGSLQTMRAVTFAASTAAPASPQTNDLWVVTDVAAASVVNSVAVGTGLSTSAASGSITLSQTTGYGMLAGGYAAVTAATTTNAASSTPVDVAGLSVTVNVAANRRIRVSFQGMMMSSVASDRGVLNIREGSTILVTNQTFPLSVASSGFGVTASVVLTPTAGSHTYVISLSRQSGTGNINLIASSGTPAYILVEDIGPANGT